jgi:hypothetical protein
MAFPTTVHGYTANLFTQEQCDEYRDGILARSLKHKLWVNGVTGTYNIAEWTGVDADGMTIFDESTSYEWTGAGLQGFYDDWRIANPNAIEYVDGSDANEHFFYKQWVTTYGTTPVSAEKIAIADQEAADATICYNEMLEALISE